MEMQNVLKIQMTPSFMPQHIKPYPVMFPALLVLDLACTTSCKRKWSCQEKGASKKYFIARGKENKQRIS